MELVNLDPDVMKHIYTLFSKDCAPVTGQIALSLMANPPQPGDPSYPVYKRVCLPFITTAKPKYNQKSRVQKYFVFSLQETEQIRTMVKHNVKRVFEVVNSLPGFSCQPVDGGAFAFPRIHLPPKAIQKAKVTTL